MTHNTERAVESVSPTGHSKLRDGWDKWEGAAKIVTGISIPVLGVLVTLMLGLQNEHNRESQFRITLMQEREKADTEIRARMFDFLLTRYFTVGSGSINTVEDFQTRRMALRLLLENFQEHFSSKALFHHLFQQAQNAEANSTGDMKRPWQKLKEELIQVGRNTVSEQLITLAPAALISEDLFVPLSKEINPASRPDSLQSIDYQSLRIPLYRKEGLTGGELLFQESTVRGGYREANNEGKPRYSITLTVDEIREDAAKIKVWIHEDKYVGKVFDPTISPEPSTFQFDASYFTTPYTDNTLLPGGIRFALIYKGCMDADQKDLTCRFPLNREHRVRAQFDVVTFDDKLITRRDRPDIDQVIERIRKKS